MACFSVCFLLFFVFTPTVSSFLRSHRTVSSLFVCLLLWFASSFAPPSISPTTKCRACSFFSSSPHPSPMPGKYQTTPTSYNTSSHTYIYVVGTLWLFLVWCFISGPFGGNTARNCRGQSKTFPLCVESLILVCLPRFYPRFPLQKKSVGTGGGQNGKSYKRQNSSRAIPPTEQHILFR